MEHRPTASGVMHSRVVGTPKIGVPEVVVVPDLAVAIFLEPAVCELAAWTRADLIELLGFSGSG
jgi:hypothetical protein